MQILWFRKRRSNRTGKWCVPRPFLAIHERACHSARPLTPRGRFMKLLRYGPVGREKPGLLDSAGVIRDLSGRMPDLTPDQLAPAKLAALAAIDPKTLPAVEGKPRMGVPVSGSRKFIA